MSKNVIVLSDGTGNAASSVWRTNVWRLFQSLKLRGNDQVAKYDDGVGTSSFLPLAILGGAFGWGLKRNILDGYKFICRNCPPSAHGKFDTNNRLFLFGFSRGAFTVRVLAGLLLNQGLVQAKSEAELHDLARKAYRAYRAQRYHSVWRIERPLRAIRDAFVALYDRATGRVPYSSNENIVVPAIEFIGVWDTVAAYGLPTDEMTRGFSNWIWPLELPDRALSPRVKFARHAVALDDERTTFHPVLWTEEGLDPDELNKPVSEQRLVQVWFAGMHSNVGGGYPDDAVAHVPLLWMMQQAGLRGLIYKTEPDQEPDALKTIQSVEDKDGRLYDSRSGLGSYYRYGPRSVADLCADLDNKVQINKPKIHESVFGRIDSGCNAYAPIGLPANYVTLKGDAQLSPPSPGEFETQGDANARALIQNRIWNYVWLRRLAYFITLITTLHLAAFPFLHDHRPAHEYESFIRLVSEAVRLAASVLPNSLHWWTDRYASNPEWFLAGIIAVAIAIAWGANLSATISDKMRILWRNKGSADPVPTNFAHTLISVLRANPAYVWLIWVSRRHVLPFVFFLAVVWAVFTLGSHLFFNIADSTGAFCKGDEKSATIVDLGIPQDAKREFLTSDLCSPMGLKAQAGYRYEITITVTQPWADDGFNTGPAGFRTWNKDFPGLVSMYLGVPLRRVLFRPWFRLIARIGETGVDEYFLDPINRIERKIDPVSKKVQSIPTNIYTAKFTARRNGELFLYVNDSAIGLPWVHSRFYDNNTGKATIKVRLL